MVILKTDTEVIVERKSYDYVLSSLSDLADEILAEIGPSQGGHLLYLIGEAEEALA